MCWCNNEMMLYVVSTQPARNVIPPPTLSAGYIRSSIWFWHYVGGEGGGG